MEFRDVLAKRRMVRNYSDTPIDADALDRIADAGLRGPSAGFSQGVRLIVVTNESQRHAVAEAAGEREYVAEGFDPWISSAPAQIVLCVDRNAYLGRYSEPDKAGADGEPSTESDWPVPYWWVDAGASLMAMLMAAVDEGLAAGFLGAHAIETLANVLAIPVDVDVVGVLTIGSPRSDRRSASLVRGWRDRDSVVFYDEWRSGSA